VAEKSNDLVAIRKLLDFLATEGAIVGPSAVNATSEAAQRASTPVAKASAESYPSSTKWSRGFLDCSVVIGM
jgi:predicted transposase YbfD/YdcC